VRARYSSLSAYHAFATLMTPERWQQITDIFEAVLLRAAPDRAAFVAEACKGDEELRREVEELLASHDQAGRFIEEPAMAVAARQGGGDASLSGQLIAHYELLSLLGSGGMGDVYLAQDTRLGRKVALKLLPDYLAGDTQRTRLFSKEARAASALNHPNIITVYEIGHLDNHYYIAMEYVDGVTLREKIYREKAPLQKLLKYMQQVAEGLTKAHAAGIVHRDLKPDNIMITGDGYAKVLDFGLAKLVEQPKRPGAGAGSSEIATALLPQHSLPGMVMGTVGYMSPEQAQGLVKEIDHRSDIFSFGCILYEAITRQKAFEGKDVLDSLHKIVHAPTPQIKETSPHAPDDLVRIVRRCLAKDPEKRYQSIKDVAIELEEVQQELKGLTQLEPTASPKSSHAEITGAGEQDVTASTVEATARPTSSAEYLLGEIKRHRMGAVLIASALIMVLGISTLLLLLFRQGYFGHNQVAGEMPDPFQKMKLTRLTTTGRTIDATISPDGKYVAYTNLELGVTSAMFGGAGTGSIWIRQVATASNIRIVEPGHILRGLTFSPDGNYLYYRVLEANFPAKLFRIPVLGGDAQKVLDNSFSPIGFSPDGKRIAFVRNHSPVVGDSNLIIANADGTDERIIATRNKGELFASPGRPTAPVWSPDGKVLACARGINNGNPTLLEVQVEGGAERRIGTKNWSGIDSIAWLPDGSALMLTGRDQSSGQSQIWQVSYPSGESHRVTNDLNDYRGMSLTADFNVMVVVQTARQTNLWLMPNGKVSEARAITSGTGKYDGGWGISWTPDGKLIYGSDASGNRDIWLLDINKGTQKQLTSNVRQNWYPMVTPDARYIIFSSDRGEVFGLWRMDMDGSNPKQLVTGPLSGEACSFDGKWIVYSSVGSKGVPTLWKIGIEGGEPVQLNDQYWEELPSVSPDGKRIAFQYFEVGAGTPISIGQLSLEGGEITKIAAAPFRINPTMRWTPDGSAIAYIDNRGGAGNIWALPVGGGAPKQLTDFKSDSVFWFDWSRDGKQLAVARGSQISDVVLISNFR
jgi:serine/threonine protein kinase/Tol biopolymer transport system component